MNNKQENLEWVTSKENSNHGTVIERRKKRQMFIRMEAVQLSDEQLISMKLMSRKQMQERDADPDYEISDWQLPEYKAA